MGYLIFMLLGGALLIAYILGVASQKRPKSGRIDSKGTAIIRETPLADEVTPARSDTTEPARADRAQKRTPPA
jgi:hypothetical protein